MNQRSNDSLETQFSRQGTFIGAQDGFYFKTREGNFYGPYPSKNCAQVARQFFIYAQTGLESDKPQVSVSELKMLFGVDNYESRLNPNHHGFSRVA